MHKKLLSTLFISFILAGCAAPAPTPASPAAPSAPQPAATVEAKADSQILKIGTSAFHPYITPQATTVNNYMIQPLFDNLTQFGAKYEVKPSVAEKWELSADRLKWTFTIRSDMKWPDGTPLTSADVVFTFNTVIQKNWLQKGYYPNVTDVQAPDARTVVLTTKAPDSSVPNGGPFLMILPKTYYESVGDDGFRAKPVGSGPYELVTFTANDSVKFKKRSTPHAYRKPQADELTFQYIPDSAQRINGLITGQYDMISQSGFSGDQADQLKKAGMDVRGAPDTGFNFMIPQGTFESKKTPLADNNVRQALNYAVNRAQIAKAIYSTYAQSSGQLAVPASPAWNPAIPEWPYDPAKAKQLLATAGYAGGFKIVLNWNPASGPNDVPLAVQSDLKAVGIEMEISPTDPAAFVGLANGLNNSVKADLFVFTAGDANGFLQFSAFGCNKPVGADASANFFCIQQQEQIYGQVLTEFDPAKRAVLLQQATKVVAEYAPAIFLFIRPNFTVLSPKTRGVDLPVPNNFNFDSVYKIK